MALTQVTGPYPIFTDLDGSPLDDGYLFIGAINDDPETNPIQVFWDSNLTIPATQPIRTSNGYAYRNGTPALLYTGGEFSITIRNKRNEFVLYSPVGYGFDPAAVSASVVKNDFTGDGVETDFTLSSAPSTKLATNIFINGIYQEKDSYSLAGNVITFSVAPPLSSSIEIMTNETGVINSGNATAISYTLTAPGAVQQTVQTKLEQYVSVKDFGAVGDGVADDTAAIQAAIDSNKSLYFPEGVYLVDELTIPATAGGAVYKGAGFYHYNDTLQTVIKARTLNQASIFTLANGADCISFEQMRLDGDLKAVAVIDGTFGAFLALDQCGVYDGIDYGVYSKQGLARITRCFMAGSRINCHLWSDSSISDSEFTQNATNDTEVCLLLAAGGNRISNVWANSGTEACVKLVPFDGSTNHINTDIVNLYAGEVFGGGVSKPIIHIEGTVGNRVQQVRIANAFIVCAQLNIDHINDGIYVNHAQDVDICNVDFRGVGAVATSTLRMNYGVNATNTENLNVTGGTFRNLNKNSVNIGANCSNINVTGVTFIDWALDSGAAGDDFAAILSSVGMVNSTGCTFTITTAAASPFAAKVANATDLQFNGAVISYPSATIVTATSGTQAWQYKRAGAASNYLRNHILDVCGVENYVSMFNAIAAASAANNSLFLDVATGKLSFKDSGGTTHALY